MVVKQGIEIGMTGAEIKTAYEGESDTNAYPDASVTKLAGIASGADVTGNNTPQNHESRHVSGGADFIDSALVAGAIPNLPASKITTGQLTIGRLTRGTDGWVLKGTGAADPVYSALTISVTTLSVGSGQGTQVASPVDTWQTYASFEIPSSAERVMVMYAANGIGGEWGSARVLYKGVQKGDASSTTSTSMSPIKSASFDANGGGSLLIQGKSSRTVDQTLHIGYAAYHMKVST